MQVINYPRYQIYSDQHDSYRYLSIYRHDHNLVITMIFNSPDASKSLVFERYYSDLVELNERQTYIQNKITTFFTITTDRPSYEHCIPIMEDVEKYYNLL